MNPVKTRNFLILIHLYLAAFLAPSFLLVAVTGALDLAKIEPTIEDIELSLPEGTTLDPDSPTLDEDVRKILVAQNIDIDFESLRNRDGKITTRPTSRTFARLNVSDEGVKASLHKPGLHYSLMELHKGHGPSWFSTFQIIAGIALFLVIIGGLVVGLLAKTYRRKTIVASLIGSSVFLLMGFVK